MLGCILSALTAAALAPSYAAESEIHVDIGYRNDALRWNIANDIDGATTPNILSELTWREVRSAQLTVGAHIATERGLQAHVSATFASILNGRNQDSDYLGNQRSGEYSRSLNDANGDDLREGTVAVGYRIKYDQTSSITPLLGYSQHQQHFHLTNGNQVIPNTGPFTGLDSTYRSRWRGPWIGAEVEERHDASLRTFLRLEYHLADYYAEANWNLRPDFEHPKSFEHIADGTGIVASFGAVFIGRSRWSKRFSVDLQRWKTDFGTDRVFFSSGATSVTRLNEVRWSSWALSFGAERRF